jgi:hypothetical protein
MALRMHVRTLDNPSKTRSGTIYSHLEQIDITHEDIECAKTLVSLRNRAVISPISVVEHAQQRYNTRYSSRTNTPRF